MSHPNLSPVWQTTPPTGEGSGSDSQAILFLGGITGGSVYQSQLLRPSPPSPSLAPARTPYCALYLPALSQCRARSSCRRRCEITFLLSFLLLGWGCGESVSEAYFPASLTLGSAHLLSNTLLSTLSGKVCPHLLTLSQCPASC